MNCRTVDHVHISAFPEGFNFFENMARDWNGGWHGAQDIRLNLCWNGSDLHSEIASSTKAVNCWSRGGDSYSIEVGSFPDWKRLTLAAE